LIPPRFGVQIVHRMLLVNKITDETGWGLISLKYEGFSKKTPKRGSGWQVDFMKT